MITTKTRKSNGTGAPDQEGATSKRLIAERLVATEICGIPTGVTHPDRYSSSN